MGLAFVRGYLKNRENGESDIGCRCVFDERPNPDSDDRLYGFFEENPPLLIQKGIYVTGTPKSSKLFPITKEFGIKKVEKYYKEGFRKQEIKSFYLDKEEVQVKTYGIFLNHFLASTHFYCHPREPKNKSHVPLLWEFQKENPNLPVTGVDWWDAYAFANWAGKKATYGG